MTTASTCTSRGANGIRIVCTVLVILIVSGTIDASAVALSGRMPQSQFPNSPGPAIPAFARITEALQATGSARVIVRLTAPSGLPGGFVPEGKLHSRAAVDNQRAVIVRLQAGLLGKLTPQHAATAKRFEFIPFLALEVDPDEFQILAASPEIDLMEEDIPVPPTLVQSVPLIGGVTGYFSGATGSGLTVAVLDTGLDKAHPFLTGKVVSEACYSTTTKISTAVCSSGSTTPGSGGSCAEAGCDHGTHVAGIIAGRGDNFSGVAMNADLIAVQVFSKFPAASCGAGATAPCVLSYTSDQILGLQRVYELRNTFAIAAVNMSLGEGSYGSNCDTDANYTAEKAAIDNLRAVGIATVIASGNSGSSTGIAGPACISTAVSVGATDKADSVASYSNSAANLHLLAPGSAIYSAVPGASYRYQSGTSMAAPHVAGAWAVLKSAKPSADVSEVLTALVSTGMNITDTRNGLVRPRIRLDAAVSAITAGTDVPVPIPWALNVSLAGEGTGTITSNPVGISCVNGSSAGCSETFTGTVSLFPTPDWHSTLASWSGDCSGSGDCSVEMNNTREVTVSFVPNETVMLAGATQFYSTLQEAYDRVDTDATIQARDSAFYEHLLLDKAITVTIAGGYDKAFTTDVGFTSIVGSVGIGKGTLIIRKVTIR